MPSQLIAIAHESQATKGALTEINKENKTTFYSNEQSKQQKIKKILKQNSFKQSEGPDPQKKTNEGNKDQPKIFMIKLETR